ncbi:MAG: hypothetical protein HGJ94_17195 [Desulfosarcina sp.]|nr:hypothetical protein [Desulfosarcina sp.]MBC2742123.1 hypothetical protein [Desulfosarcina sp.]MBC2765036.1 hypothetical protein [Desulfosarcina sp.]
MEWTAWNNGSFHSSGAGYGFKVPIDDRDKFFRRSWGSVMVELPSNDEFIEVILNIDKESFWNDSCRELISKNIGQWLICQKFASWPTGEPPKFNVRLVSRGRFRII